MSFKYEPASVPQVPQDDDLEDGVEMAARRQAALETTQGQIFVFLTQPPYKCHRNRVAFVGD